MKKCLTFIVNNRNAFEWVEQSRASEHEAKKCHSADISIRFLDERWGKKVMWNICHLYIFVRNERINFRLRILIFLSWQSARNIAAVYFPFKPRGRKKYYSNKNGGVVSFVVIICEEKKRERHSVRKESEQQGLRHNLIKKSASRLEKHRNNIRNASSLGSGHVCAF